VNYVAQLKFNLLSVSQICDKQFSLFFDDNFCYVRKSGFQLPEEWVLFKTPHANDVYTLDLNGSINSNEVVCLMSKATDDESQLWHRKLAHKNFKNMNKLVKKGHVIGLPNKRFFCIDNCTAYLRGKQHKVSHKPKLVNSIDSALALLHMDLFGPTDVFSLGRKQYCLVITDGYSRFSWVFFLTHKSETPEVLKGFITKIENQLSLKVKKMRSDNGTEFKNAVVDAFCTSKGIERQFSAARTPQQNGVAERKNRTLIEAARTMLAYSNLLITFWVEAVNTACYVQNHTTIVKNLFKTP
jgi:transposase InsO family protein